MSFYKSSRGLYEPGPDGQEPDKNRPGEFKLKGTILSMQCRARDGQWHRVDVDLDNFLGNSNGSFDLFGQNFSHSAQNMSIQEFEENGVGVGLILHAELRDASAAGGWHVASIDLSSVLENHDGEIRLASEDFRRSAGSSPAQEAADIVRNDPWQHEPFDPYRGRVVVDSRLYPQNSNAREELTRRVRYSQQLHDIAGVRNVTITDAPHNSVSQSGDPDDHITAVCADATGRDIVTIHVPSAPIDLDPPSGLLGPILWFFDDNRRRYNAIFHMKPTPRDEL